jgi:hypothetical protein
MCRKASGSQSTAFALFDPGKFRWVSGREVLGHYSASEAMGTYFCNECGSPLAGTYKGEVAWVTLGCVDGDPEVAVEKHIFMGSKAAWETSPEDVLQFEGFPDS